MERGGGGISVGLSLNFIFCYRIPQETMPYRCIVPGCVSSGRDGLHGSPRKTQLYRFLKDITLKGQWLNEIRLLGGPEPAEWRDYWRICSLHWNVKTDQTYTQIHKKTQTVGNILYNYNV